LAFAFIASSAHAEVLSLERWLLPRQVADRIEGSGVLSRSIGLTTGARHLVDVASLRVNLVPWVAVRAGLGMAQYMATTYTLDPTETSTVLAAGASLALARGHGFTLGIDVNVLHASGSQALTDATFLFALTGR
jgi:hypothetical protein